MPDRVRHGSGPEYARLPGDVETAEPGVSQLASACCGCFFFPCGSIIAAALYFLAFASRTVELLPGQHLLTTANSWFAASLDAHAVASSNGSACLARTTALSFSEKPTLSKTEKYRVGFHFAIIPTSGFRGVPLWLHEGSSVNITYGVEYQHTLKLIVAHGSSQHANIHALPLESNKWAWTSSTVALAQSLTGLGSLTYSATKSSLYLFALVNPRWRNVTCGLFLDVDSRVYDSESALSMCAVGKEVVAQRESSDNSSTAQHRPLQQESVGRGSTKSEPAEPCVVPVPFATSRWTVLARSAPRSPEEEITEAPVLVSYSPRGVSYFILAGLPGIVTALLLFAECLRAMQQHPRHPRSQNKHPASHQSRSTSTLKPPSVLCGVRGSHDSEVAPEQLQSALSAGALDVSTKEDEELGVERSSLLLNPFTPANDSPSRNERASDGECRDRVEGAGPEGDLSCVVCMAAPRDCAVVRCGHVATCFPCGKRLQTVSEPGCPICREPIEGIMRLFVC